MKNLKENASYVLAFISCAVFFCCSLLIVFVGTISKDVVLFYLSHSSEISEIAFCKPVIRAFIEGFMERGLFRAEIIAAYAKQHPEKIWGKALAKGARKFTPSTLAKMAKYERYWSNDIFVREYLLRGNKDELDLSISQLEKLVEIAYSDGGFGEIDKLMSNMSDINISRIKGISIDAQKKLLVGTELERVIKVILSQYVVDIIKISSYHSRMAEIMEGMIKMATPTRRGMLNILQAYAREDRAVRYVRTLIHQHGVPTDIINVATQFSGMNVRETESLLNILKEREDRRAIAKGAEDLQELLAQRDLTQYGQSLLLKKDVFDVYRKYLEIQNPERKMEISAMKHLICYADMDVVTQIEEKYLDVIKGSYNLQMLLISRKSQA